MSNLNTNSQGLIKEAKLANQFKVKKDKNKSKTVHKGSSLAFAYEKARNAVEYRDEHSIRQAAIERILKRRLFLNQSDIKIAKLLLKELTWARYIEPNSIDEREINTFKNIIQKYREAGVLIPNSNKSEILLGLCACEIDESLNFDPLNQIIINYVSTMIESIIDFGSEDRQTKSIQVYIATERSFARNSEILIRYKLLKVLLPHWDNSTRLLTTLDEVEKHLDYKHKDLIRRKVSQMSPPFMLIRDLVFENITELDTLTEDVDKLKITLYKILENKYKETKDKVIRASKRSIVYILLTKMVLAILIEVPFDIFFGSINYFVLAINILFPPSLMVLFNSRIKLPGENNTELIVSKVVEYLYTDSEGQNEEQVIIDRQKSSTETIFYYIFIATSLLLVLGIIYILNLLNFNFISQIIFLFFLSVVSFFGFRVREISNDYLLSESNTDSFFETLLDYLFLPIIKVGQWLSGQVAKINILSFIFDFIIEAPLKTFLEIFEQWLHFVRVKKEEFLG